MAASRSNASAAYTFLDERIYREAKHLSRDAFMHPPIDLVVSPIPVHYTLQELANIFKEAGIVRVVYMVKDRYGQIASVDNDPYKGGTKGLHRFRNTSLDVIRGTSDVQTLGTAIITIDGEDDAQNVITVFDGRELVRAGDDEVEGKWIMRSRTGEPRKLRGITVHMYVRRIESVATDNFKTPIQFQKPAPDEVWVEGEKSTEPGLRGRALHKLFG